MKYRFYLCDVFTATRFGGNQLAVLPDAAELSHSQMQQIAREFNFSETVFVSPPEHGHTRKVQIFTPTREVPFAGHPNIGAAYVLASTGELGEIPDSTVARFEEKAGLVPVSIRRHGAGFRCELTAPEGLTVGRSVSRERMAVVVSLDEADIVTDLHPPEEASVGLPFLVAQVRNRAALQRVRIDTPALEQLAADGIVPDIMVYTNSDDEFDLRARMFAPLDGISEDPATGSANCALAALLAYHDTAADGSFAWRVAQGVEMGRPSLLELQADKQAGTVTAVRVAGDCVMIAEGYIEV